MKFKNSLKILFCVTALVSSTAIFAADQMEEYKNMEQMMGAIKLEKKQVESMVDKMVASGRINPEEAAKAKRELASMNDSDLENLKNKAVAEVKDKHLLDQNH